MNVNLKLLGTLSLPDALHDSITGTCFIDGIASPDNPKFQSAVVVGATKGGLGLGVVAYYQASSQDSGQCEFYTPPANSAWPQQRVVQAICGVSGGKVAFATLDEGIAFIQVNNTPVTNANNWNTVATMAFAKNYGAVQAMLEQDGKIYGFINAGSGSENYFFSVPVVDNATPTVFPYSGTAAEAFFPKQQVVGEPPDRVMARRAALYNNRLYAIDQSHANVLSASIDGTSITSFSLTKADTWGLVMGDKSHKAYGIYTTYKGEIMPYTVSDSGFARGPDTVKSGGNVCPALDNDLSLLYLVAAPFGYNTILDMTTDSSVTLTGDALPTSQIAGFASTWADSTAHILYISAIQNSGGAPGGVMAYKVSVTA